MSRIAYLAAMTVTMWTILAGMLSPGHNDPADVTPTSAPVTFSINGDALVARQVAAISKTHDCMPVVSWNRTRHGQYPKSMILKADQTYRVTVVAWTYPAPANQWTLALCGR